MSTPGTGTRPAAVRRNERRFNLSHNKRITAKKNKVYKENKKIPREKPIYSLKIKKQKFEKWIYM
jgi:hypothetical protein